MGQSVERALCEDRIIEQSDPLVDRAVACHDRRSAPVPFDDDLVEVARLLSREAPEPEVIDDEQVRCEQTPQDLFGRVIGARLVECPEHLVGADKEHRMSCPTSRMAECGGEQRLADTHWPQKDHILVAFEKAEAKQIFDALAIKGHLCVPVEALEGLLLLEPRALQPQRQALVIAPVDLVLQGEFEELQLTEFRLPRVGYPVGERGEKPR